MKQQFASILLNFNCIILPVITVAIFVKIVLFFKFKTTKCTYYNLLYFKSQQILSTYSQQAVSIKIIQNSLSFYLVFLALLELIITVYTGQIF
jgi:hypothetical protein